MAKKAKQGHNTSGLRKDLEYMITGMVLARQNGMVISEPGCLAGDTIINVNRGGKGFKMKISELVPKFNGEPVKQAGFRPWDKNIVTHVARADMSESIVRLAQLKAAWFSGNKMTYTVVTKSGKEIRATDIHPFMRIDGSFSKLSELNVGDLVAVNGGHSRIGSARKNGSRKNYLNTNTKFHPHQRKNKLGFRTPTHRLVYEASCNGLSFDDYVYALNNDEAMSASFNFLSSDIIVHHKDDNHKNNDLLNLEEIFSQSEHAKLHSEQYAKNVAEQIIMDEIVSIEPNGYEDTYDIEVADAPHNFIANGFVVHNTGKTSIGKHALNQVFGVEHTMVLACSPSLTRAAVHGYANPVYQLTSDDRKHEVQSWITEGAPVNPNIFACILDELNRAGAVLNDELIHATHDEFSGWRPVYFGTLNWLTLDQRTLPLFDRFAFCHHFKEHDFDIEQTLSNAAVRTWTFNVPSYADVMKVRAWTLEFMEAQEEELLNYKAFGAIMKFLKEVSRQMIQKKLNWNRRRVTQWKEILYSVGAYYSNAPDFETFPAEVFEVMKFAYPSQSPEEQLRWQEIVVALVNVEQTAIDEFVNNILAQYSDLVAKYGGTKKLAENRTAITTEIGSMLQDQITELKEQFGETPEVKSAVSKIRKAYMNMLSGKALDAV